MENIKKNCRNCKWASPLLVKDENISLEAQKRIKDVEATNKAEREAKIEKIVTEPKYSKLRSIHGGLSVSKKETDIDGTYIVCNNSEQLEDSDKIANSTMKRPRGEKEGIVHKYYFTCPYFEQKE